MPYPTGIDVLSIESHEWTCHWVNVWISEFSGIPEYNQTLILELMIVMQIVWLDRKIVDLVWWLVDQSVDRSVDRSVGRSVGWSIDDEFNGYKCVLLGVCKCGWVGEICHYELLVWPIDDSIEEGQQYRRNDPTWMDVGWRIMWVVGEGFCLLDK